MTCPQVHEALAGRLGLGPSPALLPLGRIAPHPVWLRGEASLWRAQSVIAVAFEDRVWACVGLSAEEAWQAHVGAELLRAARPTHATEVPRSTRLALRALLRTVPPPWPRGSRPRILWQSFLGFGQSTVAVGRVMTIAADWGFVVGAGLCTIDPRPLPPPLLLQLSLGRWWLGEGTMGPHQET